MKRIKLLLLTAILGLASTAYIANAKSDTTAKAFELGQIKVVCEPDALESGDTAQCYIVGRPDQTGADYRVHGYVAQAYTTDYLTLIGAEKNENILNTDAAFSKATTTSGTDTIVDKDNMPDVVKGFKCNYDSVNAANAHSFGCGVFYTTKNSGATYAFTPQGILNNVNRDIIKDQGYGVIGSFIVKLDENSQTNTCGEVCVAVWRMTTDISYNNYQACAVGGDNCEAPTNMQAPGNKGGYNCVELHQKSKQIPDSPEPTPETGAFVSYAILATGAVIAIGAITMAKKNSKFNRI